MYVVLTYADKRSFQENKIFHGYVNKIEVKVFVYIPFIVFVPKTAQYSVQFSGILFHCLYIKDGIS